MVQFEELYGGISNIWKLIGCVYEGGKAYFYQGNGMQNFKTTFFFSYAFFRSSELSFLYKVMIKCFSFIHFRKKIIDTKQKRKKNTLMYIYVWVFMFMFMFNIKVIHPWKLKIEKYCIEHFWQLSYRVNMYTCLWYK